MDHQNNDSDDSLNNLNSFEEKTPFQCEICSKEFKSSGEFIAHNRVHTEEKTYQCTKCKINFSHLPNLKRHMCLKTHNNVKLFQCKVCKQEFLTLYELVKHKKIHTSEEPYQCDVCNKKYTRLSSLTHHKKIHIRETPFFCEICPKSFTLSRNLKIHLQDHDKEKPLQCDVCEKNFINSSNLILHKRLHSIVGSENNTNEIRNVKFRLVSQIKNEPGCVDEEEIEDRFYFKNEHFDSSATVVKEEKYPENLTEWEIDIKIEPEEFPDITPDL